ncbi:MAG: hypothetical protein ABIQ22_14590 [Arthrobacter oryzae]
MERTPDRCAYFLAQPTRRMRSVGHSHGMLRRRNVVERSFNILKPCRGPAARYDKPALTYRAWSG